MKERPDRSEPGAAPRRRRRWGFWLSQLAAVLALLAVLEAAVRLAHGGARPSLPHVLERGNIVSLPATVDMRVRLPGSETVRYVTDQAGARVAGPESMSVVPQVLVAGDSQALGWGVAFEDTFAARLARRLVGDDQAARILAAPATDPDRYRYALARASRVQTAPLAALVVVLNLGNDLEEMTLGRRAYRRQRLQPAAEWLARHSFLYLDASLLLQRLRTDPEQWPGTNLVLPAFTLAERRDLADVTVEVLVAALQAGPPARHRAVVVVPNDYQVEPEAFDKYAPYYPDRTAFDSVRRQVPEMAAEMDALQARIMAQLRARGIIVVDLRALAAAREQRQGLYSTHSHHISAEAHNLLADALAVRFGS